MQRKTIKIIGGGLAGSEAAWQAARFGDIDVHLYEMRPQQKTPAHTSSQLAELVCSNSFRCDDAEKSAIGLLHEEMRLCDSLILYAADKHQLPAGSALAVDREGFSQEISKKIETHPHITLHREEVTRLPSQKTEISIIATGPLTSEKLAEDIVRKTNSAALAFFDALAPVIYKDSIDFSKAWKQSRYDKGEGADYINCPLSQEDYNLFIKNLLEAEKTEFHDFEKNTPYFEGCLPIEIMASRGVETLRYGPMKPVGLLNSHTGKPAYAVIQLRQDNALDTLYNIVGFQTKMKHGTQKTVLRQIPGLENAEFARFGGIHRNSFINSPLLLDEYLRLKTAPHIFFAGQVTGVEGYIESASIGLLSGYFAACLAHQRPFKKPPPETALGALLDYITKGADATTFQPMNVNFGLFPPFPELKKRDRKAKTVARAREALTQWRKEAALVPQPLPQ